MNRIQDMLNTHPKGVAVDVTALAECLEACFECTQVCNACADACLGEEDVKDLVYCIRTDLDCAAVCNVTGGVLLRQTEPNRALLRAQLQACETACRVCAEECERHAAHMAHCKLCAESCRRCESACKSLLSVLPA
jgi:hypothetical protein